MKILVIQLARLGDIYMSWPAVRALKRTYPDAEIHFLTRPRFEGAIDGLDEVDRHWSLTASQILAPMIQEEPNIEGSLQELNTLVDALRSENFDWVVNLTFSPVSSYLTHAVSGLLTRVSGYSRYNDGTLNLSDDISAYFFAQVGPGKPNRVHLSDVFASMLDLQYEESDWRGPDIEPIEAPLPERYVVVHAGASEAHKTISVESWIEILTEFNRRHPELPVVFVGANHEREIAQRICARIPQVPYVDIVGETKISDLFAIIKSAEILIGGDSAPIHMASLTDTPTFNISVGQVNFWETGPKATLSFIYRIEETQISTTQRIGDAIAKLLVGELSPELIVRGAGVTSYDMHETVQHRFAWDLVQAIYLGGRYPLADRMEILDAAGKLKQINDFAKEQIQAISAKGLEFAGPLLDRAEEVIQNIGQQVPEVQPLVAWYQAEKIRIGPAPLETLCAAALDVHERFGRHLLPYLIDETLTEDEVGNGAL